VLANGMELFFFMSRRKHWPESFGSSQMKDQARGLDGLTILR
jgi:hypothetical protein